VHGVAKTRNQFLPGSNSVAWKVGTQSAGNNQSEYRDGFRESIRAVRSEDVRGFGQVWGSCHNIEAIGGSRPGAMDLVDCQG
jgi:hypothetical protein